MNRDGTPDVLQQTQIGSAPLGAAVCWRLCRGAHCRALQGHGDAFELAGILGESLASV